jgi:hypothetical protein
MRSKFLIFGLLLLAVGCKPKNTTEEEPPVDQTTTTTSGLPSGPDVNNTMGFNVIRKVKGIWNGPVTSSTPLGGYPEWIVDFRPVSSSQISAKNELDPLNDIHMSFFVALHGGSYKVAFRNGGSFNGMKRVSYFLADSVSENDTSAFYRFSEVIKGRKRAYTEVIFSKDSLYIKSYTNKYNTQTGATPHMTWSAKKQDTLSAQPAVSHFVFPKKVQTKDFTSTFTGLEESIYYNESGDPYPESAQPYLGKVNAAYSYASGFTPVSSRKVFLIVTTQPLFSGIAYNSGNLKYRSRYVTLAAVTNQYTFNYMHPGTYYYYAVYDNDGNNNANSGDWISTNNVSFVLSDQGTTNTNTQINFTIP